jgi:hypothetical protein
MAKKKTAKKSKKDEMNDNECAVKDYEDGKISWVQFKSRLKVINGEYVVDRHFIDTITAEYHEKYD